MKAQNIEQFLSELKVNSRGSIRNKSKVIDKIQAQHLKEVDTLESLIPFGVELTDEKVKEFKLV